MLKFLQMLMIGLVGQFFPHPFGFSPLNAMSLFSQQGFNSRLLPLVFLLCFSLLKDLVFGFHSTMLFVYLSSTCIFFMGALLKNNSLPNLLRFSLLSSFIFFLITNLGVWLTSSLYPLTVKGCLLCYAAAIPFLVNQVLGDLFYVFLFSKIYSWDFKIDKKTALNCS